jgi:hypothetical protein
MCCNKNVIKGHSNTLHLCKKTCFKATAPENTTDEYKSVCIQTQVPEKDVYSFCSEKNKDDRILTKYCKLDMCNLCCSTMDAMRKKNYSFDNLKMCFQDCSQSNIILLIFRV